MKFRNVPIQSLSLSVDIELGSLLVSRERAAVHERKPKTGGGRSGRGGRDKIRD